MTPMYARASRLIFLGLSAGVVAAAMAQTPVRDVRSEPTGNAVLGGIVTAADGRTPLQRATVTLRGGSLLSPRIAITNDKGRFAFSSLAPGDYTLSATKAGFVTMNLGAARPRRQGTPVALAPGQQATNLAIALPRGAVIAGRVTDAIGDPMNGVAVDVLRRTFASGEARYEPVAAVLTDNLGEYRVAGLPAGDYLVSADPSEGGRTPADIMQIADGQIDRVLGGGAGRVETNRVAAPAASTVRLVPVFFPGAATPELAAGIRLGDGDERASVDIRIDYVASSRIVGAVSDAVGSTVSAAVSIEPLGAPGTPIVFSPLRFASTRTDTYGHFVLTGVPPGAYRVRATTEGTGGRSAQPALAPLWGFADVEVNGQDRAVSLTVQAGMTVTGRFVFEGSASQFGVPKLSLRSRRIESSGEVRTLVSESGAGSDFVIRDLLPGRYAIISEAPGAAWGLRSIVVDGRDLLDAPLELQVNERLVDVTVTFTDRPSEVSGTLQTNIGLPTADYFILAFSTDQRFWFANSRRVIAVRPNTAGVYTMRNLPPGEYFIAALTDVEDGEWFDVEFLKSVAASSPVKMSMAEGERKRQDLRVR